MATKKLYDIDAYMTKFEAKVVSCDRATECYQVVLDQTLFFPEEGGQTPDKGTLNGIQVLDVQIKGDEIIHFLGEALEVGATIKGEIDWKHRFSNMQQHSAEHIFSGAAYKKYGYRNVGFHLSDQIVTMDFDHPFTEEQLAEMEWAVNEAIVANMMLASVMILFIIVCCFSVRYYFAGWRLPGRLFCMSLPFASNASSGMGTVYIGSHSSRR